jgi:hypothetical protein
VRKLVVVNLSEWKSAVARDERTRRWKPLRQGLSYLWQLLVSPFEISRTTHRSPNVPSQTVGQSNLTDVKCPCTVNLCLSTTEMTTSALNSHLFDGKRCSNGEVYNAENPEWVGVQWVFSSFIKSPGFGLSTRQL